MDVVEFLDIANALGSDPCELIRDIQLQQVKISKDSSQ